MALNDSLPAELQLEVLAHVVRDKTTLAKFSGVLQEKHFDNPIHRMVLGLVLDYYTRFKKAPSEKIVRSELTNLLSREQSYVPDAYFWGEVKKLYNDITLIDREYVHTRVEDYIVRQELIDLQRICLEVAQGSEKATVSPIHERLRRIAQVVSGGSGEGIFLLKGAERLVVPNDVVEKIPTGFRKLDVTLGGGLSPKELGLILAPPGRGKSALLIQIGLNALRVGKKVLHVTLELSAEKTRARYASSSTKIGKEQLYARQNEVRQKLVRMRRVVGGADVYVKEFPTKQCSVGTLRGTVSLLELRDDFRPDVVIVDYADLLRPDTQFRQGEVRHMLGSLYEGLRGLAQELQLPVWSASQSNRASLSKPIITIADIAESFEKAMVADVICAICRTRQERKIKEGRLFVAKNRDNVGEVTISIKEELAENRLWEIDRPTIRPEEFERLQASWDNRGEED